MPPTSTEPMLQARLSSLFEGRGPLLALDTSSDTASLALLTGGPSPQLAEACSSSAAQRSESLFPTLLELLDDHGIEPAGLAGIVVGLGPGSFTGLRVGLASAKGLAFGSGCRLYGTSSLALLAAGCAPGTVVVVRDARRSCCYVGIYAVEPGLGAVALGAEQCVQVDALGPHVTRALALLPSQLRSGRVIATGDFAEQLAAFCDAVAVADAPAARAAHGLWHERARLLAGQADDVAALAPRYLLASPMATS